MELLQMYKNRHLKMNNKPDLGFFYFVEMPIYSSTNELRKACWYQKKLLMQLQNSGKEKEDTLKALNKKLLKSTAILTDCNKRERYLHFLKIRGYINQLSVLDRIHSFQMGRVFPWMIFKILVKENRFILEIDIVGGFIKVTNCQENKVDRVIRQREVNGCYDLFDNDENKIVLSYISGQDPMEFTFEPFYPNHGHTIIKFIELFVEFERLYLQNRREIIWEPAEDWVPKQGTSDLAMHDGLVLFENDRVTPGAGGFKDEAILQSNNSRVKVIVGPKQILIAKDKDFKEIIDVYVITQKSPKIAVQESVVKITEMERCSISLKFDSASKGPLLSNAIMDFQQTNFQFQYECNCNISIGLPLSMEKYLEGVLAEVERRVNEEDLMEEGEDGSGEEEEVSSEFGGYDYEY